jgi:hypothetical protein
LTVKLANFAKNTNSLIFSQGKRMDLKNHRQPSKSVTDKKLIGNRLTDGITRRKALKTSAIALGACYLAPTTLDLLLADRATAQSGVGGVGGNRVACVCNFSTSTVNVWYLKIDSSVCDENGETDDPGVETVYTVPGTNLPEDCDICAIENSEVYVETQGSVDLEFKVTPSADVADQQIRSIMAGKMTLADLSSQIIAEGCGKDFSFYLTEDSKLLVEDVHGGKCSE